MKKILSTLVVVAALSTAAFAGDKQPAASVAAGKCTFAKVDRVKTHALQHLKLPAKGKEIKQACKKEWPDEFTADEWACIDASLADDKEYKNPAEVLAAVGVK